MLVVVARREVDVDATNPGDAGDGESDRAAADHEDAGAGVERNPSERVARDRQWLHQRAELGIDAVGQWHEAAAIDDHLVGEATVDRDPVQAGEAGAAQLRLAGPAAVALAAPDDRLHRHRGAVVEDPGELVAEGHRQVPRRQVQIGTADAARPHADAHRIGRVRRNGAVRPRPPRPRRHPMPGPLALPESCTTQRADDGRPTTV